jgi:signal transduction histidine kinase
VDEVVRNGDSVPGESGTRDAKGSGSGRRFPIRFKLAAALAVPMAALLFVASTKVLQTRADAQEANDQANLALSVAGPGSLVDSLKTERNHTSAHLTASESMVNIEEGAYLESRPATDASLAEFQEVIRDAGGKIEETYQPAIDAMSGLAELRQTVDDYDGPRDFNNLETMQDVFDGYSDLINQLFDANRQVSLAVNDLTLRRGASLVNLATRNSDTVAQLTRTLFVSAIGGDADGVNTSAEITRVAELLSQLRRNEVSIRENGVGVYNRYVDALFAADHTQRFPAAVQTALDTSVVVIGDVLGNAGDRDAFGYDDLLEASKDVLDQEAADLTGDANRTRNLYTIFGAAVVLLGAVMTWLVSRSITRPLRSLTRQATAMANQHLPGAVLNILETPLGEDVSVPNMAPIEIHTRDEVADVAAALNTVQESALDLAVEQAVLRRNIADSFVNLGRRNQNLLSRQLDFITELERNETDPDALASLFRLDHLATRMRRNAESLLVLAGIDPPRKWAAPVRLNDVIRAALSEIEDYQRVTVVAVEPATVIGSAAAGLAHLLAELMENAVTFSSPDQTVEVRGRSLSEGGYMLAVIDQGLGMSPDELEAANRRLAGTESFTIAPSKYLGHYVTGNLASRHGITVRLQGSAVGGLVGGGGITATIALPPALLTTEPTTDTPGALVTGAPAVRRGPLALQAAGSVPADVLLAGTTPAGSVGTLAPAGPGGLGGPGGPGGPGPRVPGGPGGPGRPGDPFGGRPSSPDPTMPVSFDPGRPGAPLGFDPTPPGGAGPSGPAFGGSSSGRSSGAHRASAFDALASLPTFDGKRRSYPPGPSRPSEPRRPPAGPEDPTALHTFGRPPSQPPGSDTPGFGTPPGAQPFGVPGGTSPNGRAGTPGFDTPPRGTPPADRSPGGTSPDPLGTPGGISPNGRANTPGFDAPPAGRDSMRGAPERPPFGEPPSAGPGPGRALPGSSRWNERGSESSPGRANGGLAGSNGGQTTSGLARRIRGANLPTNTPMGLRRSQERRAAGPSRPADDVYSFLSNFQAGVQRGLDDARGDHEDGEDRPT